MPKCAAWGEISEIISMSKNVIEVHTVLKFNFFETQLLFNTVNYFLEVFHRKHMLASHLCQMQPLIVCSLLWKSHFVKAADSFKSYLACEIVLTMSGREKFAIVTKNYYDMSPEFMFQLIKKKIYVLCSCVATSLAQQVMVRLQWFFSLLTNSPDLAKQYYHYLIAVSCTFDWINGLFLR